MTYVAALRQRWLIIALVSILGGLVGLGLGKTSTPVYRATSQVFVTVTAGSSVSDLVQGSAFAQNVVQSYAQLATTPSVLNPVIEELDLDVTSGQLAKSIEVNTPLNTFLISVSVRSGDPQEAADIANAVAEQLPVTLETLMPSGSKDESAASSIKITQVTDAVPPKWPISPNTRMDTAIGLVLGFLLGVAYAVARLLLNVRITDADDLAATASVPVLGSVPVWRAARNSTPHPIATDPARVEAYRRLRANLDFVWGEHEGCRTLLLTSALPQDGKTTTALNLAVAMAERGDRVILIDADLRRPRIAAATGLEKSVGLTTFLIGKASLKDAIQRWGEHELDVLSSGEIPPNALQLIGSARMSDLLTLLSEKYDYIVVDAPPLLSVVDAAVLARLADGTMLVASSGKTKRNQVKNAVEALVVAGERPIGALLNRAPHRERSYGTYTSDPRSETPKSPHEEPDD